MTLLITQGYGPVPSGGGSGLATPTLAVVDDEDGLGATATISSSTSGTANTILVFSLTSGTWSTGGSRAGNGTVALSLPSGASYLAYVSSTDGVDTVFSSPTSFSVTAGGFQGRINTTLPLVLEAVAARLRSQLSLTEATCYWVLDDDEPDPPTAKNFYVTISPDGGDFDGSLFDGGSADQLTDSTGIAVTIHSLTHLDRGGRDKEALLHTSRGVLKYMKPVLAALAGHDLVIDVDGNTCLRELIRPVGYKRPDRTANDRHTKLVLYFALSFDWDLEAEA